MNKVLIISYAFPPVGGGGVQRTVKFVKYLKGFNWEPLVLTVANPSVPLVDLILIKDIPQGTKIYKAKTFEPSYKIKGKYSNSTSSIKVQLLNYLKRVISNILLPDIQVLWWPGLAFNMIQVLKKEKPNCIFVSAPPFSTFIPVVFIGKMFSIPVVLDYRDEWAYSRSHLENLSKSNFARKLDFHFEKYCIKNCSVFTTASDGYIKDLINKYNLIKPEKGVCITNGYDEEDFTAISKSIERNNDIIKIVFSGTVWKGTSLKNFFWAIERLLKKYPTIKNKLKIRIFGRIVDSELAYFSSEEIKDVVQIGGYLDHKSIIGEILKADILLMSIADSLGAERIILGKTFEYMATGKHIFALLPLGETERLLMRYYGNATIVAPEDIDRICDSLLALIENINEVRASSSKDISQFSRKKLTEKLSGVFDSVTSAKNI
jgi:glycosyltransferase involved in cell wall biosynthesis